MKIDWDSPNRFNKGDFYIGLDWEDDVEIGVSSERHAITIAGAGAGKGATTIIPNIKRWPHNLLVIDPKGENAKETVADREAMGQRVYVVDPFERSGVPERYLARYNPLDSVDLSSVTAADDIAAIADGIIMRGHDPSSENWDDGAQEIIAGVIAFVLLEGKKKNLEEVRQVINDTEALTMLAKKVQNEKRVGGLMRGAASRVLATEGMYYVSNAQKNTAWLDREPILKSLETSDFDLAELKNGRASVYLVLPANYLITYSRLLRMFVRCSIDQMAKPTRNGRDRGEQCLFLLDEFFSLGKIREIAVSAGLMRGYGLQLWPIMQDIGQLTSLYGQEGSQTFFANSDLIQFFGVTDQHTAEHASNYCGTVGMNELSEPPPVPPSMATSTGINLGQHISQAAGGAQDKHMRTSGMMIGGAASMLGGMASAAAQASNQRAQEQYQEEMNEYNREMQQFGRRRVEPDEVINLTQKPDEGYVADYSINIVKGKKILARPLAYFFEFETDLKAVKRWEKGETYSEGFYLPPWITTAILCLCFAATIYLSKFLNGSSYIVETINESLTTINSILGTSLYISSADTSLTFFSFLVSWLFIYVLWQKGLDAIALAGGIAICLFFIIGNI